jgi:hypothetical protein
MSIISTLLDGFGAVKIAALTGLLAASASALVVHNHDAKVLSALKNTYATNLAVANAQAASQTVMNKTVADVYNQNFKDSSNAIKTTAANTVSQLATRTITIRVPVNRCTGSSQLPSSDNSQGSGTTSTAELSPAVSAAIINLDAEDAVNAQMHDDLVQALIKQGAKVEQ